VSNRLEVWQNTKRMFIKHHLITKVGYVAACFFKKMPNRRDHPNIQERLSQAIQCLLA